MSEKEKPSIIVISIGKRNAEIALRKPGARRSTFTSETRHLWRSGDGYTDREGNIYRERGGGLYVAGHVKHGINPPTEATP